MHEPQITSTTPAPIARWRMWPLYAAGFTTAFGAHGIAANLGQYSEDRYASLLALGLLLALYDGAEVLLKPVFGTLADRIGARPVLIGGLIGFTVASLAFVLLNDSGLLWVARLAQGASASAFSPSASALVARLNPAAAHGRAFGTYGFYKSLGYTAGPLLGGAFVALGGLELLFVAMTVLASAVAVWATLVVPVIAPLPRARQTVLDLARRIGEPSFLRPTSALAAATAALSVGVGFLPVSGAAAGLGPIATGGAISVLAACAAFTQPRAGRALDTGRLTSATGIATGLALTATGFATASLAGLGGVLIACVAIGVGTGLITPLAFAALAASTPPERLGQTMGTAELGRELGDAGGPILVAAIATATTLALGYAALGALLAGAALFFARNASRIPARSR